MELMQLEMFVAAAEEPGGAAIGVLRAGALGREPVAAQGDARHVHLVHVEVGVEDGSVDVLALAGALAMKQRDEQCGAGVEPADRIAERKMVHHRRIVGASAQGRQPRRGGRQLLRDLADAIRVRRRDFVFLGDRPGARAVDLRRTGDEHAARQPEIAAALASELAGVFGALLDTQVVTTPTDDVRSYHINSDKIKRALGYQPRHTIEDAVRELCKAFLAKKLPNSMEDDRYYNVRLLKRLKAA